jgi:SRR1 domain
VRVSRRVAALSRGLPADPSLPPSPARPQLAAVEAEDRRFRALRPAVRAAQADRLADRVRAAVLELDAVGLPGAAALAALRGWLGEAAAAGAQAVCYGLGKVASSRQARFQLALLLRVRELAPLGGPAVAYDPVQSLLDRAVLEALGVRCLDRNEEGKRRAEGPTLFFMPHCGKTLYSNVLWANWDRLGSVFVLGNSFAAYAEMLGGGGGLRAAAAGTPAEAMASLVAALPHTDEVPLEADEKACAERDIAGAFNDLSLHRFRVPDGLERPPEYVAAACGCCDGNGGAAARDPELISAADTGDGS